MLRKRKGEGEACVICESGRKTRVRVCGDARTRPMKALYFFLLRSLRAGNTACEEINKISKC